MKDLEEILNSINATIDREVENLVRINLVLNNKHISKAVEELREVISATCTDLSPLEK